MKLLKSQEYKEEWNKTIQSSNGCHLIQRWYTTNIHRFIKGYPSWHTILPTLHYRRKMCTILLCNVSIIKNPRIKWDLEMNPTGSTYSNILVYNTKIKVKWYSWNKNKSKIRSPHIGNKISLWSNRDRWSPTFMN